MPKTSLFQTTGMTITKEYRKRAEHIDKKLHNFIVPGMSFLMDYTQTKNYISEAATVRVTVVSVEIDTNCCGCEYDIIDSDTDSDSEFKYEYTIECVLKTEEPIFVCVEGAVLAQNITLRDKIPITTGYVEKVLDFYTDYHPVAIHDASGIWITS